LCSAEDRERAAKRQPEGRTDPADIDLPLFSFGLPSLGLLTATRMIEFGAGCLDADQGRPRTKPPKRLECGMENE
jgi:hypothetical protein